MIVLGVIGMSMALCVCLARRNSCRIEPPRLERHGLRSSSPRTNYLTDIAVQENWLKSVAKKYFDERAEQLSIALNLPYNKLFVRTEKRKWGNCSSLKNISLNWRLVKAPKFVIDYVIVHELVHTIMMNHSHKFWTLLRSLYPDYEKAQNWLEKYGSSL